MKKLAVLLCISLVLTLCACGGSKAVIQDTAQPATTPAQAQSVAGDSPVLMPGTAPSMTEDMQKQLLENNRALWAYTEFYDSPWFYTFTDLDHNGQMEVIAATTQGSGLFTYGRLYEVLPDSSGVRNCYHGNVEIEGPDDWPELIEDSLPCYHDAPNDRYYYACEGLARDGYAHQYYAWYALCLKNGVAEWELIASKNVDWDDNGNDTVECRDAQGNLITEQDYDIAVDRRFGGMEKTIVPFNWTQVDIPYEGSSSEISWMDEEMGPEVVITKNPTSETLAAGGKTWFIARADNAVSLTWQLVGPYGTIYSLEEAMQANPGLVLEPLEEGTIAVSNVPASLDGWGVQAVFDGQGNTAVTEPAYIHVR